MSARATLISTGEPSREAWERSGQIAARILTNLAHRKLAKQLAEEDARLTGDAA